jgi:PIN domain nuclease of toxin-antitoxin system
MKHIIDTHTLLWYFSANKQLSATAHDAIENEENNIYISQASLFEISIKVSLSKLQLPCEWDELFFKINTMGWTILNMGNTYFVTLSTLPFHHADPFDRLIACQALNLKIPVISKDNRLDSYGVSRIW